ncbi:MAG TPA: hypothetical protein VM077_00460 [Candidatus Limnocylindrales bacterium]|nr:hypothetical protein [Candidatus Limnocylindrales bacterium]
MHTTSILINKTNILSKINPQQLTGLITFFAGVLIVIGAVLPWFSLYAGLQPFPGVVGLNGRIMLGAGIFASVMGIICFFKGIKKIQYLINLSGIVLTLFSAWLIIGLFETYQKLLTQPLIVPKIGPGLFVSTVGALLLIATVFLNRNKKT